VKSKRKGNVARATRRGKLVKLETRARMNLQGAGVHDELKMHASGKECVRKRRRRREGRQRDIVF